MILKNLLILIFPLSPLPASVIFSESFDGELSQNIGSPTSIGDLNLGASTVTGSINQNGFEEGDAFSFLVADNQLLTTLVVEVSSTGETHFFGFGEGRSLEPFADDFLIATLISNASNANNLLLTEADGGSFGGAPDGALGINEPLDSGSYTVFFNETTLEGGAVDYTMTFTTTQVPEPTTSALLGFGFVALLTRRKRS
ncbi:MAG: PEP-CTERM sorting domain-containing protein [Akkermansiaceae bacterium]